MKIQCIVCEAAEAAVLCCADEAALCWGCDRKVHAANKLAGKHERIPLSTPSSQEMCDICQETSAYFFCLEDRALLCRKCDVAIHKANDIVSAHKRYLLTGVRVGLEATEAHPSSSLVKTQTNGKFSKPKSRSIPNRNNPVSSSNQYNKSPLVEAAQCNNLPSPTLHVSGGSSSGGVSQWHLDDFTGLGEFTRNYNFIDGISSKTNTGKLEDPYCSDILRVDDREFSEPCLIVPLIASPPTSSLQSLDMQDPSLDTSFASPPTSSLQSLDMQDTSLDTSFNRKRCFSDVSSQ